MQLYNHLLGRCFDLVSNYFKIYNLFDVLYGPNTLHIRINMKTANVSIITKYFTSEFRNNLKRNETICIR